MPGDPSYQFCFDMLNSPPPLFVLVLRLLPGPGEFQGLQAVNPLRDAREWSGGGAQRPLSPRVLYQNWHLVCYEEMPCLRGGSPL